jgi:hypothetical protein
VEGWELGCRDFCLWLWNTQEIKCDGNGVLTNHATIERISTRTGGEGWGQGEAVLSPFAIPHKRPDLGLSLSSGSNGQATINQSIDSALKTVGSDTLKHSEHERVMRVGDVIGHCRISSGWLVVT